MKKITILFLLIFSSARTQELDTLLIKDIGTLYKEAVSSWWGDEKNIELYAQVLLKKAHASGNKEGLFAAYHINSLITDGENSNAFADSLLQLAIDSQNSKYQATGYFLKGRNAYRNNDYKTSLDNYIKTNTLLEKSGDSISLNYIVKDNIALIRLLIGDNKKAIKLYEEVLNYYENDKNWTNYLFTKFSLAVAHHQDFEYDKSQEYVKSGLGHARQLNSEVYYYLLSVYGANQSAFGNYQEAIDSLKVANRYFIEKGDFTTQSIAYYFMGKSYESMNDRTNAKLYLQKVDSIFHSELRIYPLTRSSWEMLIDFSAEEGNSEDELYFIKSLLKVDSIISDNYRYLNQSLTYKYDVPKLLKDRNRLVAEYKNRNIKLIITSIVAFIIGLVVFIIYHNSERHKIKKYKKIIEAYETKVIAKPKSRKPSSIISDTVLEKISLGLKELEESNFYLDSTANLSGVARLLDTNSKYLSMYINEYENKSFSNYINDLRVDYMIDRLRTDKNFQKYTLDAIAKESGFTSNEHLNRAFQKKVNLTPSFFVKQITKEIYDNS